MRVDDEAHVLSDLVIQRALRFVARARLPVDTLGPGELRPFIHTTPMSARPILWPRTSGFVKRSCK